MLRAGGVPSLGCQSYRIHAVVLMLTLVVESSAFAAAPQPARSPQPLPRATIPFSVTFPDSMKVSIVEPNTIPISLPKKRFPDPAWALVGVVVGLVFGELFRLFRDWRRVRRLKGALRDECRSLRSQVPDLIDICEQMTESLRSHQLLPGPAVTGIRTVYDANITELAPHLTLLERNLLHVVHERVKVGDKLIAFHVTELLGALKEGQIADPWAMWITRIVKQIESYRVVERLLTSFLDGTPEDVFRLKRTDASLPTAGPSPGPSASIVPPTFEVASHFLRIVRKAREAIHGIEAKIARGLPVVGPRGLRPDLESLHDEIQHFKDSESRLVKLRHTVLEEKLSKAFKDVEREYDRANGVCAPYKRPDVASDSWSANPEFRAVAGSMRFLVGVLDQLAKDLERLR